jgi:hypothetical protein
MFNIPSSCPGSTLLVSNITFIINTTYSLICVEAVNCAVEIEDLIITSKDPSTKLRNSIIKFTRGISIIIRNIKIENFLLEASCVKIEDGNILISNSEFLNINLIRSDTGSGGEGGALQITVDGEKTAEIKNGCYFENCTVNTKDFSNGGAVYGRLKNGYFYVHGQTSFKKCKSVSDINAEGKGCVFFR